MIEKKLSDYANTFENNLSSLYKHTECEYSVLCDACAYSLLLGGKRIRPFLLHEFYTLCGGADDASFNFEAAVESIHTYSLIHDDLSCMDNDDLRRGKPSCHIKFGEANALLAGDALLTKAFALAAASKNIKAEYSLKALKLLADYAGIDGMIGGQTVDLLYENKPADENILKLICSLKTAALIKAACEIGCVIAGADETAVKAAGDYAEAIGLAFQIVDDILDETATTEKLGKPVHSDAANNKATFLTLYGIEKCKQIVSELTKKAKSSLVVFNSSADDLISFADYLCNRQY